MELKIEGNPGSGNHYTEVKIENIENNFPNVKEVKIIKGADGQKTTVMTDDNFAPEDNNPPVGDKDKVAKREDILKYVGKTLPLVLYRWKDKYMDLWRDILDIPAVDALIYKKGRQQKTSFNRKEVLHIICYLGKHANGGIGIFEDSYVATNVALLLADGCEKTTRPELGFNTKKTIQAEIEKLMNSKKYGSEG
jgi:hypothetical protein